MSGGRIGFDLDGTLARYVHGQFPQIGDPVPAMLDRLRQHLELGHDCRVMTARVCRAQDTDEYREQHALVTAWLVAHVGRALPITCEKDYSMIALYDDRAIAVEKNTGRLMSPDIHLFT